MRMLSSLLLLLLAVGGREQNVELPRTTAQMKRRDSQPTASASASDALAAESQKAPQLGPFTSGALLFAALSGLIGAYIWLKQQYRVSRLLLGVAALSHLEAAEVTQAAQ